MTASYVQLPPDGAGKKIRSFETTIGQDDTHTHGVVLLDQYGNPVYPVDELEHDPRKVIIADGLGRELDSYNGSLGVRMPDVDTAGDMGQRALLTAPIRREFPFVLGGSSGSFVNELIVDVSATPYFSIQAVTLPGGISVHGSNDGQTWVALQIQNPATQTNLPTVGGIVATGLYIGTCYARYLRLQSSGGGINTGVLECFSTPRLPLALTVYQNTASNLLVSCQGPTSPSDPQGTQSSIPAAITYGVLYNGTNWNFPRTPTTFKAASATASGNTAVWTPTAGKKFRLMRYRIDVSAAAATSGGGTLDFFFQDSSTALGIGFSCYVPAASVTTAVGAPTSGWCDMGNGFLSAAANNVLNINLSAALTAGAVRIVVCGTEE
jgi:hypothetical protein